MFLSQREQRTSRLLKGSRVEVCLGGDMLTAAASHLVEPFPSFSASNRGEMGALGMEEWGRSRGSGWPGGSTGFCGHRHSAAQSGSAV